MSSWWQSINVEAPIISGLSWTCLHGLAAHIFVFSAKRWKINLEWCSCHGVSPSRKTARTACRRWRAKCWSEAEIRNLFVFGYRHHHYRRSQHFRSLILWACWAIDPCVFKCGSAESVFHFVWILYGLENTAWLPVVTCILLFLWA